MTSTKREGTRCTSHCPDQPIAKKDLARFDADSAALERTSVAQPDCTLTSRAECKAGKCAVVPRNGPC